MTAQARKPAKPAAVKIRRPRKGSKAEAILTLTTTTPATPIEIAESVDTSISNVSHTLSRYGIEPNTAESYKKNRADIMAGIQEKILNKLNVPKLKIETAKELQHALTGWGILYDKERLERGQSTSNQAVIHADIAALRGAADDVSDPIET